MGCLLEGLGQPTAIIGGIVEALIATATGLGIALMRLLPYNALGRVPWW
jgi:biopolymer transport protein ExbB